jgi:hypothetical protein
VSPMRTAAALAFCSLALAACGTNPPGSASVVGTQTVRDADVAADVAEVGTQVAEVPGLPAFDEAAVTAKTVERKTRHLILAEAQQAQGITITQANVDEIIANAVTGQFGGDRAKFDAALAAQESVPASGVEEYARDFLIRQALPNKLAPGKTQDEQAKALNAYLAQLSDERGVRIAARFGTWDAGKSALGPVPNDLSVPARTVAAPSPSASPTS